LQITQCNKIITAIINNKQLIIMVSHALHPEVGAVGAKLYYPDDTIQHAGVIVGLGGVAGHSHKHFPRVGMTILTSGNVSGNR
jgi:hypothetical protein